MVRNKQIIILSLLTLLVLFSSCRSKKGITTAPQKASSGSALIQQVLSNEINYSSLELRGSTRAEFDDTKYNLSITYRNYRDSVIWISVRALLGIEVVRILCTPEEVAVYSRMGDINERGDWSEMEELVGYPIDFYSLQGLMARKLFYPDKSGLHPLSNYKTNKSEAGTLLVPDQDFFKNGENAEVVYPVFLIDAQGNKIVKTRLSPASNVWQFEVEYDEQLMNDQFGFPEGYTLRAVDSNQRLELYLKWQGISINEELKMPYQW